jgi:hypothetical protein
MSIQYRDFEIECVNPPVPTRSLDWQWRHTDYDGAPIDSLSDNGTDRRCGCSESLEDAKAAIDEWYAEEKADRDAREQHEEWMDRNLVYRQAVNKRQKELEIQKHGINE